MEYVEQLEFFTKKKQTMELLFMQSRVKNTFENLSVLKSLLFPFKVTIIIAATSNFLSICLHNCQGAHLATPSFYALFIAVHQARH